MTHERPGRLSSPEAVRRFLLAGKATVTLRSRSTEAHFTYKVSAKKGVEGLYFVRVLTGPDNEGSYTYLGFVRGGTFVHQTDRSPIGPEAPSARAFSWFAGNLARGVVRPELEVYHEGRCGACRRKLTVPESVLTGFGPECSDRLGIERITCQEAA